MSGVSLHYCSVVRVFLKVVARGFLEAGFKSPLLDCRVTFTLIDQCQDPSGRRNITYTVKPNIVNENKVNLFQGLHNLSSIIFLDRKLWNLNHQKAG